MKRLATDPRLSSRSYGIARVAVRHQTLVNPSLVLSLLSLLGLLLLLGNIPGAT